VLRDEFGNEARVGQLGVSGAQALGGGAGREFLPIHRLAGAAVETDLGHGSVYGGRRWGR
jgi:hypothetical protein